MLRGTENATFYNVPPFENAFFLKRCCMNRAENFFFTFRLYLSFTLTGHFSLISYKPLPHGDKTHTTTQPDGVIHSGRKFPLLGTINGLKASRPERCWGSSATSTALHLPKKKGGSKTFSSKGQLNKSVRKKVILSSLFKFNSMQVSETSLAVHTAFISNQNSGTQQSLVV